MITQTIDTIDLQYDLVKMLENIELDRVGGEYIAKLLDEGGFEVVKGYGASPIDAVNDLHSNLI